MREIDGGDNISAIISSLNGCFTCVQDVWFRGQPVYAHGLMPRVFRQGKNFGCQLDEAKMYEEFVRRCPEQAATHRSVYDWLTLMQHYGIPTRLLDWTTNLLVALYYCCNKDQDEDAALFAFDPQRLLPFSFTPLLEMQILSQSISDFYETLIFKMGQVLSDECLINDVPIGEIKKDPVLQVKFTHVARAKSTPFQSVKVKTDLPRTVDLDGNPITHVYSEVIRHFSNVVPFRCSHLNARIRQQHGCFTFHGGKYFEGAEFVKVAKMEEHPYLDVVKLRIRFSDKGNLLRELGLSGIKESTLFPEMEYQAKEIRDKYTKPLT